MYQQLQHFSFTFAFSLIFWLLLAGSMERQEVIAGLLVAAAASVLAAGRQPLLAGIRLTPMAPLAFVLYLAWLARALVLSNLDMARRVLSPSLPIRPELVHINTSLRSELGRLALANSITLTPGTLTVDIEEDTLTVHWVDCPPGTDMQTATENIAGGFERYLSGFLE
ncbi:MAG: Na+/H+ antiporter subunit E [Sedimenticolaceae bacterium]|jgi:multicomponent Na+:H+ antiporter subunit E